MGMYLSQDPIGLAGNNPTLYGYVFNTGLELDVWGLDLPLVDFSGHPDLFPTTGSQRNIVTIKLTGDRSSDFTRAFQKSGISKSVAGDYSWHHVADFDPTTGASTMQLVTTETHKAHLPHKGSAGQFADHFGVEYDTFEAKKASADQGWRKQPKKIKCKL